MSEDHHDQSGHDSQQSTPDAWADAEHAHVDEQGNSTGGGHFDDPHFEKHLNGNTISVAEETAWGQTYVYLTPGTKALVRENIINSFQSQPNAGGGDGFLGRLGDFFGGSKKPGIGEVGYRLGDRGDIISRLWNVLIRKVMVSEPALLKVIQNQSTEKPLYVHLAMDNTSLGAIDLGNPETTPRQELIARPGRCIFQGTDTTIDVTLRNLFNQKNIVGGFPVVMEKISGDGVVILRGESMMTTTHLKEGERYRADPDIVIGYTTADPVMVPTSSSLAVNLMTVYAKANGSQQEKFFLAEFEGPGTVLKVRNVVAPPPPP